SPGRPRTKVPTPRTTPRATWAPAATPPVQARMGTIGITGTPWLGDRNRFQDGRNSAAELGLPAVAVGVAVVLRPMATQPAGQAVHRPDDEGPEVGAEAEALLDAVGDLGQQPGGIPRRQDAQHVRQDASAEDENRGHALLLCSG